MPETTTLTCANEGCGAQNTITTPADDGWEAVTESVGDGPGRQFVVAGWRLVVRCTACGQRSEYTRDLEATP